MILRDNRRNVLQQIDALLNNRCGTCEIRTELNKKNKSMYARTDGYCNKECPVGRELQGLGKQLVRS